MTSIYNYDAVTGAFLSEHKAALDPIEGSPLVPANATITPPPNPPAGKVARWLDGGWSLVVDQRGEYWTPDGVRHELTELGIERPADALDAAPHTPRANQLAQALVKVDQQHAAFLRAASGGATIEERDTWSPKAEAATAHAAGTTTAAQIQMLKIEAQRRGVTVDAHVAKIREKADLFKTVIGIAGGLHAQTRKMIETVAETTADLSELAGALSATLEKTHTIYDRALAQIAEQS